MIKIQSKKHLYELIAKYKLNNIFSGDLLTKLELHMFKKGEHICHMGEELKFFYFFVEGTAKVYKTLPNGKSILIKFYEPVQLIGDIEIINKINANCSVQALKSSICIAIPLNIINSLALNDPNFLMYITKSLADKLASQSINSSITIVYPLETKLATYLLKVNNNNLISIPNYSNLADLLGTSYRHLNRVINKLSAEKIILKDKNNIIILNKKELQKLSGDLYK